MRLLCHGIRWSSASTCRGHAFGGKKDTVAVPILISGAAPHSNDVVCVRVKTGPRGRAGIESILTQSGVPVGVAAFIGRGRDRAKMADLLAETRVVTLTGSGGCGKTRLAMLVSGDVAGRFTDGVRWVDLQTMS